MTTLVVMSKPRADHGWTRVSTIVVVLGTSLVACGAERAGPASDGAVRAFVAQFQVDAVCAEKALSGLSAEEQQTVVEFLSKRPLNGLTISERVTSALLDAVECPKLPTTVTTP